MSKQELQKQPATLSDLLNDPATSIQDLVDSLEKDPDLTARILSRANSAMYGTRRKVTNLKEAIVFIGFRNLRLLALERQRAKKGSSEAGAQMA